MDKSTIPTVEERGLFKGLGTPPSLNAILLAFVGIVIFLVGAKGISLILSETSHQKLSYERFVLQLRDKAVGVFPITRYPIDNIFIPIFIPTPVPKSSDAIRLAVESDWMSEWQKWSDEEFKRYSERLSEWEKKKDEWLKANEEKIKEGKASLEAWQKENPPPEFERPPLSPPWWVYLIYGLWFVVVWGLFAGAVNRIYAYRIGRDESITIREAMSFGFKTWGTHIFSAILLAAFVAVIFFGCALLTAVFGKIPYLNYPGQILLIPGFILILMAAFVIGFIVVILLFSFDLISSAIAVERTDPFDAISRAYAYVTERPWHTLLYTGLALLFILFFLYFGELAIGAAKSMLAFGLGADYDAIAKHIDEGVAFKTAFSESQVTLGLLGGALYYILWITRMFILATAVALWLASRTKSYLLLRNEVDGDETDEIYIEEEELIEEMPPAPAEKVEEKEEEKKEEVKEEVKEEAKEEVEKKEEEEKEEKEEKKPKRGRRRKKPEGEGVEKKEEKEKKPKRGRRKKKPEGEGTEKKEE